MDNVHLNRRTKLEEEKLELVGLVLGFAVPGIMVFIITIMCCVECYKRKAALRDRGDTDLDNLLEEDSITEEEGRTTISRLSSFNDSRLLIALNEEVENRNKLPPDSYTILPWFVRFDQLCQSPSTL